MAAEGGTRAVVAALLANTGIAVTKLLAFLLTGSSSMLAESIHSAADSGNQALLLLGGRRSRRAATPEHPFGYGRERYVYSFLVAIVLFSVGGLFALYEAWHKYHEVHAAHGRPADSIIDSRWWWVPIVVLLIAIALEGFSFRTALQETSRTKGDASYVEFVRRAKQPELPVILLEDLAALVGLVLALVGVGMSLLTGSLYWDVAGTGMIGLLLVAVAIVLGLETKSLVLGEAASQQAQDLIRGALEQADGITAVAHMRTMHLGPDELLVAAKVVVPATDTAADVAAAIDRAEDAVRRAEPCARVIYLEPAVRDDTPARGVEPSRGLD
jgi:cation diffusion facilitator family transporter